MDGVNVSFAAAQPPQGTHPQGGHDEVGAPISRIVAEVAARCPGERITLGEMAEAFGDRAFGLLILLLCLPALLPGMASVFGLPMLILGVQMGIGWRTPHLPGFIANRSISRADLLRLSGASSNWLRRIEQYVRPRPGFFASPLGDKIFGWLTAYVAVMLILPGPGTNMPPAFGNIVMALGLVEHDNRTIAWGIGLTLAGCALATLLLVLICVAGVAALSWLV
jgi:hypothetical protein